MIEFTGSENAVMDRVARVRDLALATGLRPWNRVPLYGRDVELVSWPWCDATDREPMTAQNVKVNVRLVPGDPTTMVTVSVADLDIWNDSVLAVDDARRLGMWMRYAAVVAVLLGVVALLLGNVR